MKKIFGIFGKKKEVKKEDDTKAITLDFMEVEDLNKKYKKIVKKYESKIKKELDEKGFGDNSKRFKIFNNDTCVYNDTLQLPVIRETVLDIFKSRNVPDNDITKYALDIPYEALNVFKDTMLKELNEVDSRFTFKLKATSESKDDIEATYISNQKVIDE